MCTARSAFLTLVTIVGISCVLSQSYCNTHQNCTQTLLNTNATNQSVECILNRCQCTDCFTFNDNTNSSTDTCVLNAQCYKYAFSVGRCESTARRKLTALLLQVFIGVVGAANFYIGRIDLGMGQLFLFIILIILPGVTEIFHCRLESSLKGNSDNSKHQISLILIISILSIITIFVGSFVFTWWLADVIIFATNTRTDLNGCTLS